MTEPISDKPLISKRTVVLLPGFDPRGASHYHKMLSKQFGKYAEREAIELSVTPRKRWKPHLHRWEIKAESREISFFYAEWDDIARKYWHRSRLKLFFDASRAYLKYLSSLRFLRGSASTSYSQIGFYYPLVSFLLLYLLMIGGMGMAVWYIDKLFHLSFVQMLACITAGLFCAIMLAHRFSPHLNGGWLLRIYCFTKKTACAGIPEWENRAPILADNLAEQLGDNPPDELLIIGHSVGTITAIHFLQALLQNTGYTGKVNYMAMGQCVQLVSFLQKDDGKFNRLLREVAENPRLNWVDFTMPSDGACVALQDPLYASLDIPPNYPNAHSPKFLSARLMEGYTEQRFKELKRNHFEYHFQYYMTPDKTAEFEFAAIVLEDTPLAKRFENRENQARNCPK